MATRRDQLQSYQFLLQRVVSALVYRKTDPAQSPFRRAGGAIFAGIMLSVLALAVTALIGLFATGCGKTSDWKEGNAIIREKETGTLYVIFPKGEEVDGGRQTLYEAANFASAALLVGSTEVFEIKSESLRKNKNVDMGTTVGILGAPNSIPKPDAVSHGDWTLCSLPPTEDRENTTSKLFIGTAKTKGTPLGKEHAVFVKSGDETFLISNGRKHKIVNEDDEDILRYLTVSEGDVQEVDPAYADGIQEGDPINVPNYGDESKESAVDGQPVGTVIEESGSGNTRHWVATEEGVAEISELQGELIAGKLGQQGFSDSPISNVEPVTPLKLEDQGAPPERITHVAKPGESPLCAAFPASGKTPQVLVKAEMPNINGVKTRKSSDGTALADQIVVEPGSGALAERGTKDDAGGLYLVTASGQLFGIDEAKPTERKGGTAATADAKTALGYNGETKPDPVHIPDQVLSLIPQGPQLSPDRAMDTIPGA